MPAEHRRPHGSAPEPLRANAPHLAARPHGDRRRAAFPCVPNTQLQPTAAAAFAGFCKPASKPMEQPLLVDIVTAAHLLSVSEGSIRNLVKARLLMPVRICSGVGRREMLRFRRADIEAIAGVARKETDA